MLLQEGSRSGGILFFFTGFELPLVSLEQMSLVQIPISTDEIAEVIDSLKSNKSPGLDVLMAVLFKKKLNLFYSRICNSYLQHV